MFEMLPSSLYSSVAALLVAVAIAAKGTPYPPVDSFTGLDSYVEKPSIELATNAGEWNAVWQRHKGITPIGNGSNPSFPSLEQPPKVDFDNDEVLVIFGGLASEGGYQIVDSQKTSKAIVVRIQPLRLPGTGRTPSSFKANPYAFFEFKQTELPFRIEIPQTDSDGNVTWKKVAQVGGKN
jgi:hypothetical protein